MQYFTMQTQKLFLESLNIIGWQEKINKDWICLDELHRIPKRILLPVGKRDTVPFPDIISSPFLMVTDLIYGVIKMYGDLVYTRDVILMDYKNHIHKRYYLLVFNNIEGSGSAIWDYNIFYKNINKVRKIVVRLDFAESILRRGATGIWLEKIDRKEM